jgi:hypothetical protein
MEFFSEKVQRRLIEYCIKFRPKKPAGSNLNWKSRANQKNKIEGESHGGAVAQRTQKRIKDC